MLVNSYTVYAHLLIMHGKLEAAEDLLQKTEQFIRKYPILPETVEMNQATWVRLWLAQGDLAKASEWAAERQLQRLHATEGSGSSSFARELGEMARARILLYQGRLDDASMLLSKLAEAARAAKRNGRLIEILVLQAQAAQAQGYEDEALRYLEKSVRLGEPEGYLRVFADEGKPLETLLQAGLERKKWSDPRSQKYLERLIAAFQTPN
jgi:LuxR family maltose regulon positive regulatory protein